jgi:hypothetical protein
MAIFDRLPTTSRIRTGWLSQPSADGPRRDNDGRRAGSREFDTVGGNWLALAFRVGLVGRHPIEAQKAKDGSLGQEDLADAIAIYRWPSVPMSALRQGKVV